MKISRARSRTSKSVSPRQTRKSTPKWSKTNGVQRKTSKGNKTSKDKRTVRKSIISRLLKKKVPRSFSIYMTLKDKIYFLRFVSRQDDKMNIVYDITFTRKPFEASRFINADSARETIAKVNNSGKFNRPLDLKVIECERK